MSQEEGIGKPRFSPRPRKHGRETANGLTLELPNSAPAAKRSRRSNGSSNEAAVNGDDHRGSDSMDVDQNGFSHHEPPEPRSPIHSPTDEGQTATEGAGMDVDDDAPTPEDPRMNLTNGPSVGVQSDKVAELGPETSVLSVPQKMVMHTAWNPTDPHLLATAGEALCRIWNLSAAPSTSPDSPSPNRYHDCLDPSDDSFVTAMAWSPSGNTLAIATQAEDSERAKEVCLRSKSGTSMDSLLAAQDMVVMLKWNHSGTHLLGITSSGANTGALVVWDVRSSQSLPALQLNHVVTDAAWCDEQKFIVCGHDVVVECTLDGRNNLSFSERPEIDLRQNWSHVRFDQITGTTALASEDSALLAIIDSAGKISSIAAHDADITALAYQPILDTATRSLDTPRLLATSSLDGNIQIWNANKPFETIHKLVLGRSCPPMAMSFTPDGCLVAAASSNRVLIWNAEEGGIPKASWRAETGKWQNASIGIDHDSGIGVDDEASTYSLSWDVDGGRLAYGLGTQVSL